MTRDDLDKLHADTESTVEHTNISLRYAIAVLKDCVKTSKKEDIWLPTIVDRGIKALEHQLKEG